MKRGPRTTDQGQGTNYKEKNSRSMVYGPWSIVLLLLLACSPNRPSSPTLAQINGETVSLDQFKKYLEIERWKFGKEAPLSSKDQETSKKMTLDNFLRERLLLQEAKRVAIEVSPEEVEKSIQGFESHYAKQEDFEKLLSLRGWNKDDFRKKREEELKIEKLAEQVTQNQLQFNEKDLRSYYEQHRNEFRHPAQIRARQIVTDSKEKALALHEMILKGTPFEEVASKYSLSPDRKKGGDLGWFERGVMPEEFDRVCFYLNKGELSPVVASPYGFHLFQVLAARPAGESSFEEAKEKILEGWKASKGKEAFQKWYEELFKKAEVKVYEEVFNKIQ